MKRKYINFDKLCGPEWNLLCHIRMVILSLLAQPMRARDLRKKLKGIIADMDDVFEDWPEAIK